MATSNSPPKGQASTLRLRDTVRQDEPRHALMVFIGRFQPFHEGHLRVLRRALRLGRRVLLLAGSAHTARSPHNPWTFAERMAMIRGALTEDENRRLDIQPLVDLYNDVLWNRQVRRSARTALGIDAAVDGSQTAAGVALIGHNKDSSSYYLGMFPDWASESVESHEGLSATPIRDDFWRDPEAAVSRWRPGLPPNVAEFMAAFARTPAFDWLAKEAETYGALDRRQALVTADGVVVQSGHVLLVRRRKRPGQGLLSLPGSFLRPQETFEQALMRELTDGMGLLVTETRPRHMAVAALRDRVVADEVFDSPFRSQRGKAISRAFLIRLRDDQRGLPKVRNPEVGESIWVDLDWAESNPAAFFEDHYPVTMALLGRLRRPY